MTVRDLILILMIDAENGEDLAETLDNVTSYYVDYLIETMDSVEDKELKESYSQEIRVYNNVNRKYRKKISE